jgi:two-component system, OmpR family, sensor histidine kinase VicK
MEQGKQLSAEELSNELKALKHTEQRLILLNKEQEERLQAQAFEISAARHVAELERDRLTRFFMQAPAGICILGGPELVFELVNPAYQRLLPGRQLLNRPIFEALPELVSQPLRDILLNVYEKGETYAVSELLIPIATHDASPMQDRYFTFNYLPRTAEDGTVDGIMVFVFEVTEQVNARKGVERAEESLRMAVDAAELGSYYINTTDRIFHPSPRLKEFFGFAPDEEVPYEAAINQIHEDYRQAAADLVEAAITKGVRFDMEYPVVGYHDGQIRWVRGIGEVQHDNNGKSYFTGVLHEITERKTNEIRKNDFIAMVSHELKTPLTSIFGMVQLLDATLKNTDDPLISKALQVSQAQLRKMTKMIDGFLNLSRLESGKIALEQHPFDIDELIREMMGELSLVQQTHPVNFSSCGSALVFADRDKIGSVVSNFVSNAVKYSPRGKKIDIRCEKHDNIVRVSVSDEGPGIRVEDKDKIFDRYFRSENDSTRHVAGFGIGLYLSAEIIRRHSGTIGVDAEPGKGSIFYFTLAMVE